MASDSWEHYCNSRISVQSLGVNLDYSKMKFEKNFLNSLSTKVEQAMSDLVKLEAGEIANPDEERMVGHYWLRAPELSPTPEIREAITSSTRHIALFAHDIRSEKILGEKNKPFQNIVIIGIGGSALGPQLLIDALVDVNEEKEIFFCDNTDPDGIYRLQQQLKGSLDQTLCLVVSKSGGTVETKNGMLEFENAYSKEGLSFAKHAVAVTCEGSKLDSIASENAWLKQIYMWDWVGGRTSIFAAVGLLPAGLLGIDASAFLEGAKKMDAATREPTLTDNPALMLAAMWFYATNGKGEKDMVVLPYKDRLMLFSKYLQQLVMESIGKEKDLDGNTVHQGISVFGNKGSTDQHAYVQQLRDGVPNFFATFIEVLSDCPMKKETPISVDSNNVTSGDYLHGFFLGTRTALYESGRESLTITLDSLTAESLGGLIALFERAVSFYASFVNINAYHQPGVEAGKKAANEVISLQKEIVQFLSKEKKAFTAEEIAKRLNKEHATETVFKVLSHLSKNPHKNITSNGDSPQSMSFNIAG